MMDVRVITFKHGGLGTWVWKKNNKSSIFFSKFSSKL